MIAALEASIAEAERLIGIPLAADCVDSATGELTLLIVATDNG